MKALTIKQPWAWCIFHPYAELGVKSVENRVWNTNHRGLLLIHAGAQFDRDSFVDREEVKRVIGGAEYAEEGGADVMLESMSFSAIIGVVEMIGRCGVGDGRCDDNWADEGAYHWQLRNPRPFARAVPWKGAQRLWDVNPDSQHGSSYWLLREQLTAVGVSW